MAFWEPYKEEHRNSDIWFVVFVLGAMLFGFFGC